jgi:hypothetical protein
MGLILMEDLKENYLDLERSFKDKRKWLKKFMNWYSALNYTIWTWCIREFSAYRIIEEIKGYEILKGARGQKGVNIEKLAESIERISQLSYRC